jgi:hypothetical protein
MLLPLTVVLLQLLNLAVPYAWDVPQDAGTQSAKEEKKAAEILSPLTQEERSLDPRIILLHQPDFAADLGFFVNEGFGGYSGGEHYVRKGERYREESQYWTFVGEIGKATLRLYPGGRFYDDMVPSRISAVEGSLHYPQAFALNSAATLSALGTVEVDGHKCLKVEVLQDGRAEKNYLYAALDLKNLIIARQSLGPRASMTERLSNITLQVPDGLVDIPADFKPIDHVRWTKMESAKVTYNGKPSKGYRVFRAPGGELFIWVNDAYYPWHYLYRPQDKTVEIAFQGLLVNRSGTYIWKTAESEAFSSRDYSRPSRHAIDAHLEEIPNGIRFRSNNYKQDQATIEIAW